MNEMSAEEFAWWQVYHNIEPFGPQQEDYRAAVSAILPASAMTGEAFDMTALFRSLGDGKPKKKDVGSRFRAWALSNAPAFCAIDPKQKFATV